MKLNSMYTLRDTRHFTFQLSYNPGTEILNLAAEPINGHIHPIICQVQEGS
jgi:hypothetical protein